MPIVDGFISIPTLKWCSLCDAVLWIEHGRPPVAFRFTGAVSVPFLGLDENGQDLRISQIYRDSFCKLYSVLCADNGAALRGRPAIGAQRISYDYGKRHVFCSEWGNDPVIIPKNRIEEASILEFENAVVDSVLTDGRIHPSEIRPDTAWAYAAPEVDFERLAMWFPRGDVQNLRIGEEKVLLLPKPQPNGSSAQPGASGRSAERHPYRTRILDAIDELRDMIADDPRPHRWNHDSIKNLLQEGSLKHLGEGLSARDIKAIGTAILPDTVRGKDKARLNEGSGAD
ncbi:hypothetical protein [Azospirillum argentinense]|uniref:hypothetical protein n=1 Tax=Azospirillum argentinense TaxID=2970906 RepID=UPI0011862D50|nr:hypothetical protein [Azospirillum argentinense]